MAAVSKAPRSRELVMGYQFDKEADVIGEGVYGTVYRAKLVNSVGRSGAALGELVALKKTRGLKVEEGIPASTLREVMVLRELSKCFREGTAASVTGAENVVKLYDVFIERGVVYMVSELCDGGDLSRYMGSLPKRQLPDHRHYRQWMLDFLRGLSFLHRKGISHRDLKPQNLVLKKAPRLNEADAGASEYILKLVDFGLSRLEGIPVKKYQHESITLWYRGPDVLLGNTNYSYTADIWSAGCIMAEMASGCPLFRGRTNAEQLKCIFSRLGPPTERNFPSIRLYALYDQYITPPASTKSMNGDAQVGIEELDVYANARDSLQRYFQRYNVMEVVGDNGVDLLAHLLAYEPKHRFSVSDALQHPFFLIMTSSIRQKAQVDCPDSNCGCLQDESNACFHCSSSTAQTQKVKVEESVPPREESQHEHQDHHPREKMTETHRKDKDNHIEPLVEETRETASVPKSRRGERVVSARSGISSREKRCSLPPRLNSRKVSVRGGSSSKGSASSRTRERDKSFHSQR